MFDRSTIFRDAHEQARKMFRYGGFRGTYRQALAASLKLSWHAAKLALAETAWETAHPVSAAVEAEAIALRSAAWFEPITAAGNARFNVIHNAATALVEAARFHA